MPEGPSIVILKKEEVHAFTGQKIIAVTGNSKIDQSRLVNRKVISFKSWGKHFYFNNTASTAGILNALMLKTGDFSNNLRWSG